MKNGPVIVLPKGSELVYLEKNNGENMSLHRSDYLSLISNSSSFNSNILTEYTYGL